MLIQAVFDKLWIMDREVVGSDLTDTYHDLLTAEAQHTLTPRNGPPKQSQAS